MSKRQFIDERKLSPHVDYKARTDEIFQDLVKNKKMPGEWAAFVAHDDARTPFTPYFDADDCSAIPNELVRCGLFSIANPGTFRKQFKVQVFHVQADYCCVLSYTGEELRQDDRQVFMELLAIERNSPGVAVIKLRAFCNNVLGWGDSNSMVERLDACLTRLSANEVRLSGGRFKKPARLSLIRRIDALEGKALAVRFEEEIRTLYRDDRFTLIVRNHIARLPKRSNLASWLLGFYASHREPKPMELKELQRLCGSVASPREFKREIKKALTALKEKALFLSDYSVVGNTVSVTRA